MIHNSSVSRVSKNDLDCSKLKHAHSIGKAFGKPSFRDTLAKVTLSFYVTYNMHAFIISWIELWHDQWLNALLIG